jgi:hypothetical protein
MYGSSICGALHAQVTAEMAQSMSFSSMPVDLQCSIVSFLACSDLARVSAMSHGCHRFATMRIEACCRECRRLAIRRRTRVASAPFSAVQNAIASVKYVQSAPSDLATLVGGYGPLDQGAGCWDLGELVLYARSASNVTMHT